MCSYICHLNKDRIAITNIKTAKFEEPAMRALQRKAEICHVRKTWMWWTSWDHNAQEKHINTWQQNNTYMTNGTDDCMILSMKIWIAMATSMSHPILKTWKRRIENYRGNYGLNMGGLISKTITKHHIEKWKENIDHQLTMIIALKNGHLGTGCSFIKQTNLLNAKTW